MNKFYEIQIESEYRCILNCRHCSAASMRRSSGIGYSDAELLDFLKIFTKDVHIYLTGGEPLLRNDICHLLDLIKSVNERISIGVFSSGVINKNGEIGPVGIEYAQELRNHGIYDSYISLYHEDPYWHDYITNAPGSHSTTMNTIRNFLSVHIKVRIHLVINRHNINNLLKTIEEIERVGVEEIRLLRMVKSGNAIENWDEIGISYELQNEVLMEIISKMNDRKCKITISGFPEYYPCRPQHGAKKCQAGINILYINSHGEVYPCACTNSIKQHMIGTLSRSDGIIDYLDRNEDIQYREKCLNPIIL